MAAQESRLFSLVENSLCYCVVARYDEMRNPDRLAFVW